MKILLVLAIILAGSGLFGQHVNIKDLKPILAAIQVRNLDSCIDFYSKYLGLELIERKQFADYHLEIAFLKKRQFELELVKNDSSIDRNIVLKEKKAADITGFAKLNFKIKRIEKLYDFLKAENINIVVSLRKSGRIKKYKTFIITDPEGNWVQFTGK